MPNVKVCRFQLLLKNKRTKARGSYASFLHYVSLFLAYIPAARTLPVLPLRNKRSGTFDSHVAELNRYRSRKSRFLLFIRGHKSDARIADIGGAILHTEYRHRVPVLPYEEIRDSQSIGLFFLVELLARLIFPLFLSTLKRKREKMMCKKLS